MKLETSIQILELLFVLILLSVVLFADKIDGAGDPVTQSDITKTFALTLIILYARTSDKS